MKSIGLTSAQVGDTVVRMLAGAVPMKLKVVRVDDTLVYCGAGWMFERRTGFEYDPDLHWGSEWGCTGSFIVEIIPKET